MRLVLAFAALALSGCSVMSGVSRSCEETKSEGTRMCTTIDSTQNITTRSIERNHRLFISTCSNGSCTEFREVGSATTTP